MKTSRIERQTATTTLVLLLLLLLVVASGCAPTDRQGDAAATGASAGSTSAAAPTGSHPSAIHARVTTVDGETVEGRVRFGGDQEAFWGDHFNGVRDGNPWVAHVPVERRTVEFLGFEVGFGRPAEAPNRPFMVRFGDIASLWAQGRDLRVTLKDGTVVELDRYSADDFADGVTVWTADGAAVELDEGRIRTIEFIPADEAGSGTLDRLHGTVRTSRGAEFTGFLQLNRRGSVGSDRLLGQGADGESVAVAYGDVRSITRRAGGGSTVELTDGRELALSGTSDVGEGNRGVYVDDVRYGRVLVPWAALDRVAFDDAPDAGPGYDDYPAGHQLRGEVTARDGRRLAGRLVYDLDESRTVETLDAPAGGVDYTIPFALVGSIARAGVADPVAVTLRSGEELLLEPAGDLGTGNAGLLVFADGAESAEYVPWAEVARVDLDGAGAARP